MNSGNAVAAAASRIEDFGIVAVVRLKSASHCGKVAEALMAGGIRAIEITMTTPNALEAIQDLARELKGHGIAGVGSVVDVDTCRRAMDAGAEFVVSPIGKIELIPVAHGAGRAVMLGAYTPTEAYRAQEAGADFVKVFPADGLGAAYIRAIRAPMPHLRIVPTGGVDLVTLGEFVRAGCPAVGVGSSLLAKEIIDGMRWEELRARAEQFSAAMRQARQAL